MNTANRLHELAVRLQAILIVAVLVGSTMAFGGIVWWARPVLAACVGSLAVTAVAVRTIEGRFTALRSPLGVLGGLVVALGLVQLMPLPAALARRISPRAQAAYSLGVIPTAALADDPEAALDEPAQVRSPATLDRSATLRWTFGALACWSLFCVVAGFTDRLERSMLVWSSVVGSLFLVTLIGSIQLLGQTEGFYGYLKPGEAPAWAPSVDVLRETPNTVALREVGSAPDAWAAVRADRPAALAGLPGGPGAYLALASLALPLALGMVLQFLAPRGAQGQIWASVRDTGHGGTAAVVFGLLVVSALVVGWQAGRVLCVPFAIGLLLCGLPAMRGTGLKGVAAGATAVVLVALLSGVVLGERMGRLPGASPLVARGGWTVTLGVWNDAWRVARDFPLLGAGMGSFATIHPYYKSTDPSPNTALSSLFQWIAEGGLAGLVLAGAAATWVFWKVPTAVRQVGSADRALAFALLGSLTAFALFSTLHWSVELSAVALAASAVAGTCHRWLAGGTDLFVARA